MKTQGQIKRGFVVAAKLISAGVFRVVVTAVALLCAADARGQGIAPINPKHVEWQKQQEANRKHSSTKGTRRGVRSTPDDGVSQFTFGYVPGLIDKSYLRALNVTTPYGLSTSTLPASYDRRTLGHLTAVRDQGQYGTCWAHSTIGALETILKMQGKGDSDFSEKHMANTHGWSGALKGGWTGVFGDGAWAETAIGYLVRWSGPIPEEEDPYPSDFYKYNNLPVPPSPDKPTVLGHVQNVMGILPMPSPESTKLSDTEDIKNAIMQYGSVRASYMHVWGALTSDRKNFYWTGDNDVTSPEDGGHSVLIIGWDDNYSKTNFIETPPGNGAFIAKNSWGTDFGDKGFFYISYYDWTFGRDELHAIPDLESPDNYGDIYQHDPLGWVNNFGGSGMTMWGANVFTAKKRDAIGAIGFYAATQNTRYELSIYTGCSSSNPTSGNRAYSASGSVPFFGYVTVPLAQGVDIALGQKFSIVLKLTTPGNSYPLPIEYATARSMEATASAGQSFYSNNGTSWTDFTAVDSTANFCCKAYTKSESAEKPKLSSIAIISDTASLKPEDRIQLKCEATFDNNSKSNVTAAAQWSLTTGQGYATISSSGMLTGKDVAVPEPQTIMVQAIYTEDGVSATNRFGFAMVATAPDAPVRLSASQGAESSCVRVTWAAPAGATEYAVYRATVNNAANAQYIDRVTVPKYNDTTATPGIDYWYFVKAKNSSGTSGFSEGARGWRALAAPANVSASDGASVDFVKVTWDAVEGASCYRVFRAESFDGDATPLTGWISATEFTDSTAEPGTVYWYSVVAATDSAGTRPSAAGIPDDGFRAVPVVPSAIAIEGDGAIPSGGAASYAAFALYSDGSLGESPLSPAWEVSAGTVSRTGGVTAPTVSENTDIVISAHTTLEGVAISGTKTVAVTATAPGAPTGLRLVSATAAGGVSLAWDAVPGASRYVVSRGANGVTADFTTAEATFTDTSAMPGVAYSYRVAAENAAGTGPQSAAVAATIPLAAPTGVKATNDRTDGVRVTWGAVPGATHYRVARAVSATGEKTELGAWTADTACLDTPPATDTAYFYFVKAATDSFGSNPGAWSAGVEGRRKAARTLLSLMVSGPDRVAAGGEAVYSCKASWSDGAEEAVSPAWSVSPASAGSIDANGRFAAASVSSDVGAIVTATYGGKTGTASVTVLAPAAATAEITSVTAAQRWPFASLVDIDYTLATTPAGTRAAVSVSAFDEDHGAAVAATTLSGDGAEGPVAAGTHRLTWNLGVDHPGLHAALRVNVSAVPASLAAPTGLSATASTSGISLSWSATSGATSYEVYRATTDASSSATCVATPSSTSWADTSATPGTRYYYWVKAVTGTLKSEFSSLATAIRLLSAPTGLAATASTSGISLSWSATSGATSYEVYRTTADTSSSATCVAAPSSTSWADTTATPGTRYYYWVKAVAGTLKSEFSSSVNSVRTLSAPTGIVATQGDSWDSVSISWTNVVGASQYEIWRSSSLSQSSAVLIGTRYSSPYSDTTALSGTRYYYWVRAVASQTGAESPFSTSASGYRPDISTLVIEGASSLSDGGSAYYEVMAKCTPDGETRTLPSSARQTLAYNMTDTSGCARFCFENNTDDAWGSPYRQWLTVTNAPSSGTRTIRLDAACTWNGSTKTGAKTVTIRPKLSGVDFTYQVNSASEVAIQGYTGNATSVSIPSTLNGMTVTALCPRAFRFKSSITSVVLPNTITIICGEAFFGCNSLTALDIPPAVTRIGAEIITGTKITSISIPASVSQIDVMAFKYAASLKTISVDSSNERYASYAGALFNKDMTQLIAIPAAKTGTFAIPPGVKYISNNYQSSFCGSKLTSVSFPASVNATPSLWGIAFSYCHSLSSVSVNSGNETLCASGNVLFSKDMKTLHGYPAARSGSTYTIPSSVEQIQWNAFSLATKLTSLAIPASVTNIACAFSGCTNLVSIYCFGDAPTVPTYSNLYQGYDEWDASVGGYSGYRRKTPATIYYLSGTSGWGEKLGGLSTSVWNNPIQSLSIDGSSSVKSGTTSKYMGLGTFQSGHSGIACKVTWCITSGGGYATIDSSGLLTTTDVQSSQTITIRATATLGGATRTATKSITVTP